MAQPVCVLKEHEGQVGESGDPLAWACVTRKPSHHGRTDRNRNTSDVFPIEGEEGGGLRRASRSDGLCRLQTQTDKLKHDSGPCIESCRASGYSPPPRRTRSKGVSLFSARWSRSIKCPRRAGFCLLLMADFYRQPASAYRFWQRLVLPSRSLSTWPGLEETFPARISKRSPNPLSHPPVPPRPAAHDLPQGGQPESFHRRVIPARTFPVDAARKDVPLLMIGLECGAANQRIVPLTTISCAQTVPIRIITPAGRDKKHCVLPEISSTQSCRSLMMEVGG